MVTPGQVLSGLVYEVVPPVSHCLLITGGGEGGWRGSHFNENGPHHKSRSDQVHPQFRLKDSKHRDKIDLVPLTIANIQDKIRLPETAFIPLEDSGGECSIKYLLILMEYKINGVNSCFSTI